MLNQLPDYRSILESLFEKKSIRPLDWQFAKFMGAIESRYPDEVMFLAALVSQQLGQGHICLPLTFSSPLTVSVQLNVYGELAQLIDERVTNTDWQSVVQHSSTIASEGADDKASPLVWHSGRLYLQRYFDYEQRIGQRLYDLAMPITMSPSQVENMASLLDRLFAREYGYLFERLRQESAAGATQVKRQQVVCDYLDITAPNVIDWERVEDVITQAKTSQQLEKLSEFIPLTACLNWQKVAAAVALTRRFAVISGGPGTGKTTTVTKLLAALVEQGNEQQQSLSIKLVAPTGKAAARLTESIGKALNQLAIDPEVKAQIPTESSTLHRLLGAIPNQAEYRHSSKNPLHLDVLVLDEASMVDLPMMYKLLQALPKKARLILLGDKDQLASVEAGAVLADICAFTEHGYSSEQNDAIKRLTQFDCSLEPRPGGSAIADSLCVLQKSYRFDARSGIGQLAKYVNNGDVPGFRRVWEQEFSDIEWQPLSADTYQKLIARMALAYRPYITAVAEKPESELRGEPLLNWQHQHALSSLNLFAKNRLLCAVREGDFGVVGVNQRIEARLKQRGIIANKDDTWYQGRPIMVTKNDHGLGLFNGDIGLCMWDHSSEVPRLKVFFELPDGSIKSVLPSRVPEHETAYAMTIHKSQGSEFEHTFLLLPADYSPILTKELIYTGITRAKHRLSLIADASVIAKGIRQVTVRHSGLMDKLTGKG